METDATEWLGASAQAVAESLVDFTKSSQFLSAESSLVQKYDQKWIGVCAGEVRAAEDNLEALLCSLDSQGIPRSNAVVRFVEREQRPLFL